RGAGCSATASHGAVAEIAGQGGAFRESGATKMLAFVVVNAYGCIVDRSGKIVRGKPTGPVPGRLARRAPSANTTLSLVVTNQKLDRLSSPRSDVRCTPRWRARSNRFTHGGTAM